MCTQAPDRADPSPRPGGKGCQLRVPHLWSLSRWARAAGDFEASPGHPDDGTGVWSGGPGLGQVSIDPDRPGDGKRWDHLPPRAVLSSV